MKWMVAKKLVRNQNYAPMIELGEYHFDSEMQW